MSTAHEGTCRQLAREAVARQVLAGHVFAVHRGLHVGHSAAAIEVVDDEGGVILQLDEQAIRTGHRTAVSAAVEVAHLAGQQVPRRTDAHLGLVVATEEASYLVLTAARL